jgi:hypothetical protein
MIFFLAFNLINTHSLCFTVNENKMKILTASKTKTVQKKITRFMQDIHNLQSAEARTKEKLNLKLEINKMREFGDIMR